MAPPNIRMPGYESQMLRDTATSNRENVEGATFYGEVSLANVEVEGEVDFARVLVQSPRCEGRFSSSLIALSLYRAHVKGHLRLGRGFRVDGLVALEGARIGGSLDLQGGWFLNPNGIAIAANRVVVAGDIVLSRKWTRKALDSTAGHQDENRPQPRDWKSDEMHDTDDLARNLLKYSSATGESMQAHCEHLALLINAFVREHILGCEDEINAVGVLERRFVAFGLVSLKAARIDGDIDVSGSLLYANPLAYQGARVPEDLRRAVENRRDGDLSRWTALDISHASIGRALFLTRWVPRRPSSGGSHRTGFEAVFPIAVSGVVDLTASDVHQFHLTPGLFTSPRYKSRDGLMQRASRTR